MSPVIAGDGDLDPIAPRITDREALLTLAGHINLQGDAAAAQLLSDYADQGEDPQPVSAAELAPAGDQDSSADDSSDDDSDDDAPKKARAAHAAASRAQRNS